MRSRTDTQSATRRQKSGLVTSSKRLKRSPTPRIEAKELPNLLRQIEVYPGTHVTRLAIKLMALTFVRTSELIEAKWSEFNLKAARWDIPAERMKMRTPHIVPLTKQALEVWRY